MRNRIYLRELYMTKTKEITILEKDYLNDLKEYGKGFSIRNLHNIRKFSIDEICAPTWCTNTLENNS